MELDASTDPVPCEAEGARRQGHVVASPGRHSPGRWVTAQAWRTSGDPTSGDRARRRLRRGPSRHPFLLGSHRPAPRLARRRRRPGRDVEPDRCLPVSSRLDPHPSGRSDPTRAAVSVIARGVRLPPSRRTPRPPHTLTLSDALCFDLSDETLFRAQTYPANAVGDSDVSTGNAAPRRAGRRFNRLVRKGSDVEILAGSV